MIKIFELFLRKPDNDHQAFLNQLTAAAGALGSVADVLGYDVQEALPLPARRDIVQLDIPAELDAFVEIWAEDVDTYRQAMASDAAKEWREARRSLVAAAKTLVLEERPVKPVPAKRPPTRNNAFLTRNARFHSNADFLHEWLEGHGDMALDMPYLQAFVPCVVRGVLPQEGVAEIHSDEVEGIAQAYFNTPEEEIAMIATPQAKHWFAHGAQTFGLIKAFGARETVAHVPKAG